MQENLKNVRISEKGHAIKELVFLLGITSANFLPFAENQPFYSTTFIWKQGWAGYFFWPDTRYLADFYVGFPIIGQISVQYRISGKLPDIRPYNRIFGKLPDIQPDNQHYRSAGYPVCGQIQYMLSCQILKMAGYPAKPDIRPNPSGKYSLGTTREYTKITFKYIQIDYKQLF